MKKNVYYNISLIASLVIVFVFFCYTNPFTHQQKTVNVPPPPIEDTTLTLFFAGDLMGHEPMINAAKIQNKDSFEYNHWFKYLTPTIEKYDFSIVNLEVTLGGEPYSGYPQFSSPDSYAAATKKAGFDYFITANNHSLDRGKKGLERTLDKLDELKIPHTGTFKNEKDREDNYPSIQLLNDKRIAILNYTYGTNGLIVQAPNIVNLIDTSIIKKDIQNAKSKNSDFILLTIHWGSEYQRNYNSDQKKLAQWLCDKGVDAIIGMHPHVVQPMEILHPKDNPSKNVPVAYSLGNFISNQRARYKNGGIGVGLHLKIKKNEITFDHWEFVPIWVRLGGTPRGYYTIPAFDFEKNEKSYGFDAVETTQMKEFISDTRELLNNVKELKE